MELSKALLGLELVCCRSIVAESGQNFDNQFLR